VSRAGHDTVTVATKRDVRDFWEQASCGEVYADGEDLRERLDAQARARYELEPFIAEFAHFHQAVGKDVLEIGVGMGADHLRWAREQPRRLIGVDLTPRAVAFTRERLALNGFEPRVLVADAETLPFPDASFEMVYSWGVLHHSPDPARAIREVHRVLRPGGRACIMIYQRHALVGYMLWARYAFLAGKPWRSLDDIYAEHLESPGTHAYSIREARSLFAGFSQVRISTRLSPGDLLTGAAGQRHSGRALTLARRLWPRPLIRALLQRRGLFLIVEAIR